MYDHYICYSQHHRKNRSKFWLEWWEIFPFLYLLFPVNSGIPLQFSLAHNTMCYAQKQDDGIHSVWEHSLWNLWNIHTTRCECIKDIHVWCARLKCDRTATTKGIWMVSRDAFNTQPQRMINIWNVQNIMRIFGALCLCYICHFVSRSQFGVPLLNHAQHFEWEKRKQTFFIWIYSIWLLENRK